MRDAVAARRRLPAPRSADRVIVETASTHKFPEAVTARLKVYFQNVTQCREALSKSQEAEALRMAQAGFNECFVAALLGAGVDMTTHEAGLSQDLTEATLRPKSAPPVKE